MRPERWHEIEQLYNSALEIESGRRSTFLEETCAGDISLRKQVETAFAE